MINERYDRQTILTDFGPDAQHKLKEAKVLVIGAGGLGVPVLTYLNAMGVGTLGMVDNDRVALSNLHRQVLYNETDIGKPKVQLALKKLTAQNSETQLIAHEDFLNTANALRLIAEYDVIVDASDNFPTRYLVNDACVILEKPFIYGALYGFEGQVSVLNYQEGPTYRCLFPTMPKDDEVPNCNENGVLGVIPGIVGNLQALETVKVITGVGKPLSGELLLFNGLSNVFQKIRFSRKAENVERTVLQDSYDFECETSIETIDAKVFQELLDTGQSPELIDVRTEKEFARHHLKCAKNIPLSALQERQTEIVLDKRVYFICQSGIRSKKAIEQLQQSFSNTSLINVSGGMNVMGNHAVKH
ncbi:HesA/MoeB/ThiF family protein [Pareuzebyella sediminis]|uniref:HesA/MoeB/ThiF family protein n=1 Tax=Pareuzebyella sediminis TaxID=2607998 RepID=UPI0011EEC465|nr:HesA/MoeB/ThiF family protein [Pareuzebyella sediminis]